MNLLMSIIPGWNVIGPTLASIGTGVLGNSISKSIDKALEARKLSEEEKAGARFLKEVFTCLENAVGELDVSIEIDFGDWKETLDEIILKNPETSRYQGQYLPHYKPVELICDRFAFELGQNGVRHETIQIFRKRFNINIFELSRRDDFEFLLKHFRNKEYELRLVEHLEEVIAEEEYRLIPEDPPLKDVFIWPNGRFQNADHWQSLDLASKSLSLENQNSEMITPLVQLIELYFTQEKYKSNNPNTLKLPMLVIGADFGIGKSSFSRMYAALIARSFLQSWDGYVPVYFSLKNCSGNPEYIFQFLKQRKLTNLHCPPLYMILDGLDESGPVTDGHIEKMLSGICGMLLDNLPAGSKCIVTSRLILGPKGGIAMHMRKMLGNNYIRILGFDEDQVVEFLAKCARFDSRMSQIVEKQNVTKRLSKSEYGKPLYIWMLMMLERRGLCKQNTELPFGRTELYLQFLSLATSQVKIKGTREAKTVVLNIEKEKNARYMLRQLAALRNILPEGQSLSEDIIYEKLSDSQSKIYREIGEIEFMSLSYFGYKGDSFEFTHQSFKEFLLAEYILCELINASQYANQIEFKLNICIGELSFEAMIFLERLIKCFAKLCVAYDGYLFEILKPIIEGFNISIDRDRILSIMNVCKLWVEDEMVMLLKKETQERGRDRLFNLKICNYPQSSMNIYEERFVALAAYHDLNAVLNCNNFNLYMRKNRQINKLESLLNSIRTVVLPWKRTLFFSSDLQEMQLEFCNLYNFCFSHANMTGTTMYFVELDSAFFSHAIMRNVVVRNSLCRNVDFSNAKMSGSIIIDSDFQNANFDGANLQGVVFKNVRLSGANFDNAIMEDKLKDQLNKIEGVNINR